MTEDQYARFVLNACATQKLYEGKYDLHAAVGLSTEAGEFLQCYRKECFQNKEVEEKQKLDELADVYFYFTLCRLALNVTEEQLRDINVEKLTLRKNLENLANKATNGVTVQPIRAHGNGSHSDEYNRIVDALYLRADNVYTKLHNDKPVVSKLTAYGRLCQRLSKLLNRV